MRTRDSRRPSRLTSSSAPPCRPNSDREPFRNAVAGGIDVSLPVSLGLAAVIYLALLFAFPEPRYAFGPQGPRWVPVRESEAPPVVDDPRASVHRAGRRQQSPSEPIV